MAFRARSASRKSSGEGRSLDHARILKTLVRLQERAADRFPDRGLTALCGDLVDVARLTADRVKTASRSPLYLRFGIGLVLVGALALAWSLAQFVGPEILDFIDDPHLAALGDSPANAMQAFESVVNLVILAALAIWFLLNLEARWKRRIALRHLHELRSLAHVVDMHQLTKDPVMLLHPGERRPTSPVRDLTPFELSRYLDYCVEMLSLIGKLAALYAEQTDDAQVIETSNDIEALTTTLSRKIWQKIVVIGDAGGERSAVAVTSAL